jgi:hypothetical protein
MNQNKINFIISASLVVFAASMKAVTFPYSINPIIAISLFSGAIINNKKLAFMMPLMAMFFSDLMLEIFNIAPGFYGMGQIGNYASLLLVTVLGFQMKKINGINVAGFSIASSLLFFFLSNTNCFFFDTTNFYGAGITGWSKCIIAGIPFLKNGMAIDLGFSALLFTSYHVIFNKSKSKVLA